MPAVAHWPRSGKKQSTGQDILLGQMPPQAPAWPDPHPTPFSPQPVPESFRTNPRDEMPHRESEGPDQPQFGRLFLWLLHQDQTALFRVVRDLKNQSEKTNNPISRKARSGRLVAISAVKPHEYPGREPRLAERRVRSGFDMQTCQFAWFRPSANEPARSRKLSGIAAVIRPCERGCCVPLKDECAG